MCMIPLLYVCVEYVVNFCNKLFSFSCERRILRKLLSLIESRHQAKVAKGLQLREELGLSNGDDDLIKTMKLIFPPPQLCTDNGVMAAWAGIEKLNLG